jgi:hypothetical protein
MIRIVCLAIAVLVARSSFAQTPAVPALPDTGVTRVVVSTEAQLQAAVRSLASNTTIVLQPGTYLLTAPLYVKGPLTNVSIRGASSNRNDAVIAGRGMRPAGSSAVPYGIWTGQGVDGITIANLTIRDIYYHSIILNPLTAKPVIYNVRLLNAGSQFIKGNPDTSGNGVNDGRLEYSLIEYTSTSPDYYTQGIDIHGGWNWRIRYNVFRNIVAPAGQLAGPAVLMWNGSGNTVTEGNWFFNCARGISYGLRDRASSYDHAGGIIRNNVLHRTWQQPGDVAIHVADSPDTQILNNTVFLGGTYATPIEYRYPSSARITIVNNVLDGQIRARDGGTASLNSNIMFAPSTLFVDALGGDLHLRSTATAAIDKGVSVGGVVTDVDGQNRPSGPAYDIGADEVASSTPDPGVSVDVVLYTRDATAINGAWRTETDATAAGGLRLHHRNAGRTKVTTPLASPVDFVDVPFTAEAGRGYRLWIRGRADRNDYVNDSAYVQFSGSVTSGGTATYRIGTTSVTTYVLEDCSGCTLSGWGWQDNGYGIGVLGPLIYFATSGPQTIRIQGREDGLSIDQIVLSPQRFITTAPGAVINDATIVTK